MSASNESSLRCEIIDACRSMNRLGINQGTSGNVSARLPHDAGILITPSGIPYDGMEPGQLAVIRPDGRREGGLGPSSELEMHLAIYRGYAEASAVVHSHPPYATALACLHMAIPAFHYMVAVAGGTDIKVSEYATYGTPEMARAVVTALEGRRACLIANHGTVAYGRDVAGALALAVEVEALARQYHLASQLGSPALLGADEMSQILERFRLYGRPPAE